MEEFVRRQNLLLLRKRLDDPSFAEAECKVIRRLLAEEQAKNPALLRQDLRGDQKPADS
jgi:hypothetical protein